MVSYSVWHTFRNVPWLNFALFVVLASIPFYNYLNRYALILFVGTAVFTGALKTKKKHLSGDYLWVFSALYFLIIAASVLWDPNGIDAFKSVEKNASFLIIAPLIASLQQLKTTVLKACFLIFVCSTSLVCFLCLYLAWTEYQSVGDYRVFYYQYLAAQMDLNAIYLSLYSATSIIILLYYYFIRPNTSSRLTLFAVLLLCAMLCFMVMLLSSKMILAVLCLLIVVTALYIGYLKKFLWQGLLFIILFMVGGGYLLWQMPYVKWRVQVTLLKDYENKEDDQNGLAVRKRIWQHSAELIKEKPLLGYGIMAGNEELIKKYEETKFKFAAQNKYNCHNLYLQLLINTGIVGLLPLIIVLFWCLLTAIKRRSYLFCCFMVLFLGLSITESLLEVQKGIVFVVVFLFLLYYHPLEVVIEKQPDFKAS